MAPNAVVMERRRECSEHRKPASGSCCRDASGATQSSQDLKLLEKTRETLPKLLNLKKPQVGSVYTVDRKHKAEITSWLNRAE